MSAVEVLLLSKEHVDTLTFVLLHSLWQAAIYAVVLWVILRIFSANWASFRYIAGVCAMLFVVVSMIVTWSVLDQKRSPDTTLGVATVTGDDVVQTVDVGGAMVVSSQVEENSSAPKKPQSRDTNISWTTWFVIAWLLGASLMSIRVAWIVSSVRGLVRAARELDGRVVIDVVNKSKDRLGIARHVRVMVCDRIDIPAVVGVAWPVLLIPPAMLTGIPANQLRVIIAHELAHVRRYDYLVNLCQMLLESVLFFNPAVWWICRQIRVEREACCDALAVAVAGPPMDVAKALVDFAERLSAGNLSSPPLVQAMSEDGEPSSLFARVTRIVLPDHRPRVRLPWHSFVAISLACGLLLFGIEQGTRRAVVMASEWLTPPEHVRRVAELQKTHGTLKTPRQYSENEKVNLVVSLTTDDGLPVPKEARVAVTVRHPRATIGYSLNRKENDRFEMRVEPGKIYIRTYCAGYAPCSSEPISCKPGGKVAPIELTLRRGFTTHVRVVDSGGNPVPAAKTTGGFLNQEIQLDSRTLVTDKNGLITLENCPNLPFRMNVDAKGFQYERRTIDIAKGKLTDYIIQPATPARGRVISAATGKPISGAVIDLVGQFGNPAFQRTYEPYVHYRKPPRLTRTDADGQFVLDRFRDDCEYALLVSADGFGPHLVQPVRAGQQKIEVALGPARFIRGKITGPLDKLTKRRRGTRTWREITFSNPVKIGDANYNYGRRAEVEIRDGVGHFFITDLLPGKVSIRLAGKSVRVDPQPSIDDLTIDLSKPDSVSDSPKVQRTVIFRIQVPQGAAEPRGEMRLDYIHPDHPNGYYPTWQPVNNSEARLEVPVPTRVRYETGRLVGYWVEEKTNIEVVAGDEPLVVNIPAIPAGAVFGKMLHPDGTLCENFNLSVIVVKKPESLEKSYLTVRGEEGVDGKYVVSPLPLGGRYRIVADDSGIGNEAKVISKELHITPDNAIRELDLQFVEGTPVTGRVVDPVGQPVAGASISLHWSSPYSHSFGGGSQKTDRGGTFRFNRVNADLPGEFRLHIKPTRSFQGRIHNLVPSAKPVRIALRRGAKASGVLVEDETGRPIPKATIRAFPTSYNEVNFTGEISTQTGADGNFEFLTLEATEYRLRVEGAVHPNVRIEKLPDGRTRYHFHGDHEWTVIGGKSKGVAIRAKLKPGSALKPLRQ